ncbi:hypothetical protein EDB81DRAFT_793868 [Dactylonectria macrodidyma]|uniref:Uncharacterized protein n=1 Tax=Dactylonectria macrodidyma TaxID=307937 RepID=A0A9P9EZR0_9HYPO|nr:hypothetical protein EDB81DRAFT_793868 [Dactylonectria macrodidyma]
MLHFMGWLAGQVTGTAAARKASELRKNYGPPHGCPWSGGLEEAGGRSSELHQVLERSSITALVRLAWLLASTNIFPFCPRVTDCGLAAVDAAIRPA